MPQIHIIVYPNNIESCTRVIHWWRNNTWINIDDLKENLDFPISFLRIPVLSSYVLQIRNATKPSSSLYRYFMHPSEFRKALTNLEKNWFSGSSVYSMKLSKSFSKLSGDSSNIASSISSLLRTSARYRILHSYPLQTINSSSLTNILQPV